MLLCFRKSTFELLDDPDLWRKPQYHSQWDQMKLKTKRWWNCLTKCILHIVTVLIIKGFSCGGSITIDCHTLVRDRFYAMMDDSIH